MSEHTPGPWRWLPGDHLVGDAGRTTIIRDGAGVYNATQGDKKLIAAAPDLLAALETSPCPHPARDGIYTAKDCIEIGDCGCDNRAAIAKATGQGSGA